MTLRLLLVDDQALVRSGFRMLVEAQPGMEVVGEAADGHEAVAEARRTRPDVVLMDIRMPRMDGIEATRLITEADPPLGCKVLILTTYDLDEYVFRGLRAGASGFLLKDVVPEELVKAIRTVAEGESLLSPSVTRRLIEEFVRTPDAAATLPPEFASLTERENEVFILMGKGLANREISERLFLSMATVKTHVNRVFSKLRLRDRAQAVVLAYETGIVGRERPSRRSPSSPKLDSALIRAGRLDPSGTCSHGSTSRASRRPTTFTFPAPKMFSKPQEEVLEMEIAALAGAGWGGGPWFLFFPLLWIALFAGAFFLFRRRRDRWQTRSAEEVLAERYAKGEISADEYRQRLNVLQHKAG